MRVSILTTESTFLIRWTSLLLFRGLSHSLLSSMLTSTQCCRIEFGDHLQNIWFAFVCLPPVAPVVLMAGVWGHGNGYSKNWSRSLSSFRPEFMNEDWLAHAAFRCPACQRVFIVSARFHRGPNGEKGYRECPTCAGSIRTVTGADGIRPHGKHRMEIQR